MKEVNTHRGVIKEGGDNACVGHMVCGEVEDVVFSHGHMDLVDTPSEDHLYYVISPQYPQNFTL